MSIVSTIKPSMAGAYIFPSSSAEGIGKTLTESNLRQVTNRIVNRNYKMSYSDFTVSQLGENNTYLQVSGGIAIINGYRVVLPSATELSYAGLEDDVTYDISLRLSKQTSADTFIVNVDDDIGTDDNGTGAIYFQFDQSIDTNKTINDHIVQADKGIKYRPAVYRNFDNQNLYHITDNISNDDTVIDYSGTNYCSSSIWNFNKMDGLFVNKWHDVRLSNLDLDKADESSTSLSLVVGWVKVHDGAIVDVGTYNCMKRIDADNIFVGETTLDDYLITSGTFVKTYGGNVISAIRDEEEDIITGYDGKVLIPFVSTADTKRFGSSTVALSYIEEYSSARTYVKGDYAYVTKVVESVTQRVLVTAKVSSPSVLDAEEQITLSDGKFVSSNADWDVDNSITAFDNSNTSYTYGDIVYIESGTETIVLYLYQKTSTEFPLDNNVVNVISPTDELNADNTYWIAYNILVTRLNNKYMYVPYTYSGESYVPIGNDQENGNNDVGNIKSILECSFNSINAEDTPINNEEIVDSVVPNLINGAQILHITSMDECFTSYTYGVVKTDIYNADDPFNYKYVYSQNASNKFYVGFNSPSLKSGYIDVDSVWLNNVEYNKDNNYLVKYTDGKVYRFISDTPATGIEPTVTSGWENYWEEQKPQFGEFGIYDDDFSNHIWIQPVYDTTSNRLGKEIDIMGNIININNGHRNVSNANSYNLKMQDDNVTYEVTDITSATENPVYSEVGFRTYVTATGANNNATDIAAIRLYRDDITSEVKESYIYMEADTDTNDKPKLGISSSLMVRGYVRADRVYNAVYNDYAEWYNSSNAKEVKEGDIIYYNPETDEYSNHSDNPQTVVGICTEDYGMIVGGDDISNMENNRENHIPVSLCGRVKVKVNPQHTYECGDYIYADGTNIGNNTGKNMVGKFLKYCDNKEYALVQVCLS